MNTMNTIIIIICNILIYIGLLAWVIWEGIKIKVIIPNMLDTTEDVNIPDGKFVESDTKS